MWRWFSFALLISIPCFLALVAYDVMAIFLLKRGGNPLVPAHDLARGVVQDLGLALVYAVTVTPRVFKVITDYPDHTRRLALILLGLGIAWYDVVCAAGTRMLPEPPGLAISLVVLFFIPIILAPSYVRWLKVRIERGSG